MLRYFMGNSYSSHDTGAITPSSHNFTNHASKYNWVLSYPQKKIRYMTTDNLSQFMNKDEYVINNEDIVAGSIPTNKKYVDLRSLCPDILDDKGLHLSAINTLCFVLHYQLIRNKLEVFPPSRLFIYHNMKQYKGDQKTFSFDTIFKSIQSYGFCSELSYNYTIDNYNENHINDHLFNEAEQYKYINIYRIPNSIDMIKTMLNNHMIPIIGFVVYNNIHINYKINLSDTNTNTIIGGTTGTIVGYIDTQQSFIVGLSYGRTVGKNGYILLPYKYVENKDLVPELYYIDFDKTQIESFVFSSKQQKNNIIQTKKNKPPPKAYGGLFS
jgi:hypothetical protein